MSRTKNQWLKETGGFRIGESPVQFKHRTTDIALLRKKIADGRADVPDVEKLNRLLSENETAD